MIIVLLYGSVAIAKKMATKRNLYHPAPKTNVGEKKTRRPLVQGRLVTDNIANNNRAAHLVQGQLITDDELLDPTISPMKSVPVLTELKSPRPEPPSHCLDLSDADFDASELSESGRPKPVMVFDASHLGNSPRNTEVEVLVAYEDSPARVICHTPAKLEQSLRTENKSSGMSPHAGGDIPHWAVKVDKVQKLDSTSKSGARQLFTGKEADLKSLKEARNKASEEEEHYISHQSRGIIEEILAQELGSSNVDAISLHSETNSPSPHSLVNTGAVSQKSTEKGHSEPSHISQPPSRNKKKNLSGSPLSKGKSKNVNFRSQGTSYPQPKFDDESDTSTDRIPVKEKTDFQPEKEDANTDSETCSLYEYVTPKKQPVKEKPSNRKPLSTPVKNVQEWADSGSQGTARKKKTTRVVPSRYMQSSTVHKSNNQTISSSKNSSSEPSLSQSQVKSGGGSATAAAPARRGKDKPVSVTRPDTKLAKSHTNRVTATKFNKGTKEKTLAQPIKSSAPKVQAQPSYTAQSVASSYGRNESPHTVMQTIEFSDSEPNDQKTSTPTHDQTSHFPHDIDASAIQSLSAMSINMSSASVNPTGLLQDNVADTNQVPSAKHLPPKSAHKSASSQSSSSSSASAPTQVQLDLDYTRYLQWAFLNSKAQKMLRDQEMEAMTQLQGLWELLETKREENAQLEMDISKLKKINLMDNVLDKTEGDLESLTAMTNQLEEDYSRVTSALDITRHQLPTQDIYIPQTEVEKDIYEEKLERALRESEQLLAEISSLSGSKTVPLTQYLDNLEAIDRNVSTTQKELKTSQRELETVQGLSTRLTSLYVQEMQSP